MLPTHFTVRITSLVSAYSKLHLVVLKSRDESRAPSLGPSDSASQRSQQSRFDPSMHQAIEQLLQQVEPPSIMPDFLPKSVLWYANDSKTDNLYGPIYVKGNNSRPRMQLAVRRPNGDILSHHEFANIREFSDLVVRELLDKIHSANCDEEVVSMTKSAFKSKFYTKYRQAILKLEAAHPILRLCAGHWKAETMIGQSFLRRSGEGKSSKATRGRSNAPTTEFSVCASQSPPPLPAVPLPTAPLPAAPLPAATLPVAPIPNAWDVAPMSGSKRALEMSPGPKSPSVSHVQKRPKDKIKSPGLTSSSLVPSGECYSAIQ